MKPMLLPLSLLIMAGACADNSALEKRAPSPSGSPDTGAPSAPQGPRAEPPATDEPDASVDPPPPPPVLEGDPAVRGSYAVLEQEASIDLPDDELEAFQATLYLPSTDEGKSAASLDHEAPLLVLMPGFTRKHGDYKKLSQHFASWGFVVLGLSFLEEGKHDKDVAQALAAIDWALGAESPISALIDPEAIVTTGHSLGGKIAFYAAALDPRVKVVVGWDPVDSGGAPCWIPVAGRACNDWSVAPNSFEGDEGMMGSIQAAQLVFHAPPGLFNPEAHNSLRFWEGTKSPAQLVKIPDASHLDWGVAENGKWDTLTARTQLAFMLKHLYGTTGTEPYLDGEVIAQDVAAGTVVIELKQE